MTPIQLHTVCVWHNLNGFIYCRDANCRKIIKKKEEKKFYKNLQNYDLDQNKDFKFMIANKCTTEQAIVEIYIPVH